jgi:UDP-N-acetylmuramate dehydrogenase
MSVRELIKRGRERVEEHANLGTRTTYRVGGSVRALVTLHSQSDLDDLGPLIFASGLPVAVIGNGSNLLVADGEHEMIALHLLGEFAELTWHEENGVVSVIAGAGLDLPIAARRLSGEGIVGFEWAVGVPGTFGGAVAMNAGGHGSDMAASITSAVTYGGDGRREWTREELGFGYRTSALQETDVVTSATLRLERGDAKLSLDKIKEIVRWRRQHQPGGQNGGSAFRNPSGEIAGRLIEQAGCKGLRYESAVVSDKHANFIIVDRDGRANDIRDLMRLVAARVKATSGIDLVSEHHFIGFGDGS